MNKFEEVPMCNDDGQVNDPDIAYEMAKTEDSYHKKRKKFGVFNLKPKKETMEAGEKAAKEIGETLHKQKTEREVQIQKVKDIIWKEESLEEIEKKISSFLVKIKYEDKNKDKFYSEVKRTIDVEFYIDQQRIIKEAGENFFINDYFKLSDEECEQMEKKYGEVVKKKIKEYWDKLHEDIRGRLKDLQVEVNSGYEVVSFKDGQDEIVVTLDYKRNNWDIIKNGIRSDSEGKTVSEDQAKLADQYYKIAEEELQKYKKEKGIEE